MTTTENKKTVFLIVSGKEDRLDSISEMIKRHHEDSIVYTAPSGNVGLLKIRNAAVDIVVADSEQFTPDIYHMLDVILNENKNSHLAIMIAGSPPREANFLDELVTGKICFIDEELKDNEFAHFLAKALNFNVHTESATFQLRYLAPGDTLIKEGEIAEFVYILRTGQLQAFNFVSGKKLVLGKIEAGEFVGEMAYINNEPRSAFIEAITDAELIEVPIGIIDKILYKRPAWTKALMQTLSKRLKTANKISIQA